MEKDRKINRKVLEVLREVLRNVSKNIPKYTGKHTGNEFIGHRLRKKSLSIALIFIKFVKLFIKCKTGI
jgi:hypothetical protein